MCGFGGTPSGLGIHALNLDADVGPWLQVLKLKGLKEAAEAAGRGRQLSGAEIELMNLAGPRTGLEMMTPLGRTMPTSNFFSEGAATTATPSCARRSPPDCWPRARAAHGTQPQETRCRRVRSGFRRAGTPLTGGAAGPIAATLPWQKNSRCGLAP